MPSTVVHCALAGLLAAGLLAEDFDARAVAVVLAVTIFPDLDVFAGFVIPGGHRSVLHTLLIPLGAGVLLAWDTRARQHSWVRDRWKGRGVRVLWVSLVAYVIAAIGLDLAAGGANLLYPLHDQFYSLDGKLLFSNQRGLVQTFVQIGSEGAVEAGQRGSSETVHVNSGIDPTAGSEPENVERIFPVAQSGWQLLLVLSSILVLGARLRESRPA